MRNQFLLTLSILSFSLIAYSEKNDAQSLLERGKALMENGKHEEGSRLIQKAADQDLPEAIFWLGYTGAGKGKPISYYEKAAEKGFPKAFELLLDEILFQAGSDADVIKAHKFAEIARKLNVQFYDSATKLRVIDRCFEAGSKGIPTEDQPTENEKKSFRALKTNCDFFREGLGVPKDLIKYRKCLLSYEEDIDNNFLAEIYANGWGVKRNPQLALALVCHASAVTAELYGLVETLYSTKDQAKLKKDFLFCDHVTSGMSGGICASKNADINTKKREIEFEKLVFKWTETQKGQFAELRKVANQFFSEHAREELDLSGTARAQIAIQEEEMLQGEFIQSFKAFEEGALPNDTDFKKADAELNRVYSRLMKQKVTEGTTVTKAGIKGTQRKWLKFRDAWTKFALAKYPTTCANGWNTWMTQKRIEQLKTFDDWYRDND